MSLRIGLLFHKEVYNVIWHVQWLCIRTSILRSVIPQSPEMDCTEAPHSHRIYSCSLPCPQSKHYSNKDKKWNVTLSFNAILSAMYRRILLRFPLTSRQADGSAAMPLHVVFRADVDVLFAQPPQAKVGCLAGLIDFIHPRAEHCPMVRYHCREHASHTHQKHEDGNLYLCALVHVSRWWDFCSVNILPLI